MFDKEIFKKRLKELRESEKITQFQLSDALNIGRASVSNYELGARIPDVSVLVSMAEYFGVTTDYLSGNSDFKNFPTVQSQQPDNKIPQIYNSLEQLKRTINTYVRVYKQVDSNNESIIQLINKLLEDLIESIDFLSFTVDKANLGKFNEFYKIEPSEINKMIKEIKKNYVQMPMLIGIISMDLHDLISYTQNLTDNIIKTMGLNERNDIE